jgi:hypothetical protein
MSEHARTASRVVPKELHMTKMEKTNVQTGSILYQ